MSNSFSERRDADAVLVQCILAAFPLNAEIISPDVYDEATWAELVKRARYHGISLLLYAALEKKEWCDVPSFVRVGLLDLYRSSALASATAYYELNALIPLLNASNIPLIVLKGAAVAKWLYPVSALRPFADLDFLIPQTHVEKMSALLQAQGYVSGNELARGFRAAYYSEMAFHKNATPRTAVDLHWNLFVPLYYRRRMSLDWFWQHTQAFSFGAQPARILDATAQFIHLAVHASLNHQNAPRLIWLYDLALLLTHKANELDWDAAIAYTHSAQLAYSVHAMLRQTIETWHLEFPPERLAAFRPTNLHWRERLVFRITGAASNQARVVTDALGAATWRDTFAYAARHLFPDAAYMQTHYRFHNRLLLPYYYSRRLVASVWKLLGSLWSASRNKRGVF